MDAERSIRPRRPRVPQASRPVPSEQYVRMAFLHLEAARAVRWTPRRAKAA